MTKNELLDFIDYIRKKEEVVIDPYITRSLFARRVDRTDYVRKLVEKIKNAPSTERAYKALAFSLHGGCVSCEHKRLPRVYYYEDFYEYLLSLGFLETDAEFYAKTVSTGNYKKFSKEARNGALLTGDLHIFAYACKRLPRRDSIAHRLHTEYNAFKEAY